MRGRLLLPLLLLLSTCALPPVADPPPPAPPPPGTILTVLLELRPPADTLVVFDVIRGPGRLRTNLPARLAEPPPANHLTFTFLSATERVLRQTSLPRPGPNEYEAPDGNDGFTRVVLPEEARSVVLRVQDTGGLRWLDVHGTTPTGSALRQRFDLTRQPGIGN